MNFPLVLGNILSFAEDLRSLVIYHFKCNDPCLQTFVQLLMLEKPNLTGPNLKRDQRQKTTSCSTDARQDRGALRSCKTVSPLGAVLMKPILMLLPLISETVKLLLHYDPARIETIES